MPEAFRDAFSGLDEFVAAGGFILPFIAGTGVLLWSLIAERAWWFWRVLPARRAELDARWRARPERSSWTATRIRAAMIGSLSVAMTQPLPLLRALIPISPLLGLLGTVGGMLEVFDVMAIRGTGDAQAMADGVSHAMVATLSGLGVALSGMYFSHHFTARARHEAERLNLLLPLDDQHGHGAVRFPAAAVARRGAGKGRRAAA